MNCIRHYNDKDYPCPAESEDYNIWGYDPCYVDDRYYYENITLKDNNTGKTEILKGSPTTSIFDSTSWHLDILLYISDTRGGCNCALDVYFDDVPEISDTVSSSSALIRNWSWMGAEGDSCPGDSSINIKSGWFTKTNSEKVEDDEGPDHGLIETYYYEIYWDNKQLTGNLIYRKLTVYNP